MLHHGLDPSPFSLSAPVCPGDARASLLGTSHVWLVRGRVAPGRGAWATLAELHLLAADARRVDVWHDLRLVGVGPGLELVACAVAGLEAAPAAALVDVTTRSGRRFAATPHHRVATERGWKFVGDLTDADVLVACRQDVHGRSAVTGPDDVTAVRRRHGAVVYELRLAGAVCGFVGDALVMHRAE